MTLTRPPLVCCGGIGTYVHAPTKRAVFAGRVARAAAAGFQAGGGSDRPAGGAGGGRSVPLGARRNRGRGKEPSKLPLIL
jgi:hypothetical protein